MIKSISKKETIILISSLITLVLIVLFNTRTPFFDEVLYLRDVAILHQYGFSKEYLLRLTGSAGPLYSIIHYLFEPITHLKAPFIRLINVLFLLGIIYLTNKTIILSDLKIRHYGLYIMAIPMSYVIAGLALTEVPAMFFLSLGIYITIYATTKKNIPIYSQSILMICGGICFSISILGRQPYLVLLGALPILFIENLKELWKQKLLLISILFLFSLALPTYIFWIWKDLVPPIDATLYNNIAKAGTPYRFDFFLLCISYYAISMLIIAPGFYKKERWLNALTVALGFISIAIINYIYKLALFLPFHSVTKRIFESGEWQTKVSILFGAGLISIALYFIYALYKQVLHFSKSKLFLFYSIALLLIALTCAKITWGFSSRYAAQSIPLLVLIGAYYYKSSRFNFLPLVGIFFGIYSLLSYILYP